MMAAHSIPIAKEESAMRYAAPGTAGAKVTLKSRYANFIGGQWVPPASGEYFDNLTPVTGKTYCEIPRSNAQDIERALDAAHAARTAWGRLRNRGVNSITVRAIPRAVSKPAMGVRAPAW